MRRPREDGQATPEWLGVVLVVSLTFLALISLGVRIPGTALAFALGERLICAVGLGEGCGGTSGDLALVYGSELASLVSEQAPSLEYEEGMRALPVDFRDCREDACAEGADAGEVRQSVTGEPVTVFTHVIDCGDPEAAADEGFDCSGDRAGHTYLQYWLYFPGSQTSRALFGDAGFHPDDWESFQVRIGSGEAQARASSHHGYNGQGGDPMNDTGLLGLKDAWTESTGRYWIAGGSHAGQVGRSPEAPVRRPSSLARGPHRWTPASAVRLIPIESLADTWDDYEFEVTPPWLKTVYSDPEHAGT